jgi:hydroxyethylthiazole kinase-like uncharacterized protein yjeF
MAITETILIPDKAKLVTVAEMHAIERAADAEGHSYAEMMEIAGRAVALSIVERYGESEPSVLILVGPGNNGGDGLVCARHLHQAGINVRVYLWKRSIEAADDYEQHFAKLVDLGIDCIHVDNDADFSTLSFWLNETDILVDSLLGTGANRPIQGHLATLLQTVSTRPDRAGLNRTARPLVVAVDSPSGLNCDTGSIDPHALSADLTVTFACAKYGHFLFPGAAFVGELLIADIGTSPDLTADLQTFVLTEASVSQWLPDRNPYSHKGTFGKVLLAVGSVHYPGAAYLSCAAAGRAGAGLVTGAIPEPVWPIVATKLSEPTWLPLAVGTGDATGAISKAAVPQMGKALSDYNAFVLGCGLGQTEATQQFVAGLLTNASLPATVIDADGLNCLALEKNWQRLLPHRVVLTPHPAEMARLCNLSVQEVVADRWNLARRKAAEWNAVILLKGPYTVIADPSGLLAVLPVATPALATAGTGDILAGTIGGLLAQHVTPFGAACLGAWLHGKAGEQCATEIGPAGVIASDLLALLPHRMNFLRDSVVHEFSAIVIPMERSDEKSPLCEPEIPLPSGHRNDNS